MLALLIMTALMFMCLGLFNLSSLDVNVAGAHRGSKAAFYATEAGIEQAVADIMSKFDDLDVYADSATDPASGADGYLTMSNLNRYTVKYRITNPLERFLYTTVVGATTTFHYACTYDIEAIASIPEGPSETIKERMRILETPLVQYFIFYGSTGNEADLEWLPGPSMNSWGRVHSNGDVYIGCGGTLAFRNYDDSSILCPHSLTAGGSILRKRKNDGSVSGGTVTMKVSSTGTTMTPSEDITGDITLANWATEGPRFNDYLLINFPIYGGTTTKSLERGDFYEQRAENPGRPTVDGIKIVGRSTTGGIKVFVARPAYTEVTTLVNGAEVAAGVAAVGMAAGTIVQETTSPRDNKREGKPVTWTEIDLNLLENWYVQYLDYQADGSLDGTAPADLLAGEGILIYASRTPAGGYAAEATLHAIKLAKSTVPQLLDETTFVTDNPLYVEGDFNTVSRRGCALICDSINVLSNNWETAQAGGSSPDGNGFTNATVTNINAAFFGGNVPTPAGGGTYSGGLENYPRFHENWSGVACNMNACFINLWSSVQGTSNWSYGSPVYTAPQRNWGWDVNFQNYQFWPPFVPSFFSIERVGWKE